MKFGLRDLWRWGR